jgi:sporulation protein YlmC with PRC-barrel domain
MKTKYDADNITGINHEGDDANDPLMYLSATSIIGDDVINGQKKKIGKIKDIMIDLRMGNIQYVIVEMGGFLGIGEKFFAIPYSLLQIDPANKAFILNQYEETLKNAPGFDKNHWPETNSHYYYDTTIYWDGVDSINTISPPY